MTKSIKEIFEDTQVALSIQMHDAVEEAISKIYAEYLPHVENDTYFNVRALATDWILHFMNDRLNEDDLKLDVHMFGFTGQDIRAKMFQDNREELTKLIGEDIVNRVKDLEERVAHHWEQRYG